MKLYLIRHGESVENKESKEPALSAWGKFEVEKTAGELAERIDRLDIIFHSGKLRARQTALIIQSKLKFSKTVPMSEMDGLKPNDSEIEIVEWANEIENDIMLVGHLPQMDKITRLLLKKNESNYSISFGTACAVSFERGESGEWFQMWFYSPR